MITFLLQLLKRVKGIV